SRLANRLADPWLIVLLNLPALVIIVFAYIWAGLTETAAVAAVALNKLPIATVTVREGARSLDTALDEMAQVFRMRIWMRIGHIVLPQLAPYLAAAARSGLSLVWKIVLIVELLGRPNGVGFEIGVAFQLFDVTRILAYALAFVAVMLAVETLLVNMRQKSYRSAAGGSLHVLGELAFSLKSGEVVALVGPSGCGKTTLLRIISGLDHDFQGRVALPAAGRLGMVFQEPRLLAWRTVEQNVRLAAPRMSDDELATLFEMLELTAHRNHYPG